MPEPTRQQASRRLQRLHHPAKVELADDDITPARPGGLAERIYGLVVAEVEVVALERASGAELPPPPPRYSSCVGFFVFPFPFPVDAGGAGLAGVGLNRRSQVHRDDAGSRILGLRQAARHFRRHANAPTKKICFLL